MDHPPRPLARRTRRPAARRLRLGGTGERRTPPRLDPRGDRWSLEDLVGGLADRVETFDADHPDEPIAGWLYRVIDAWAADLEDAWRARSAAGGLPIVREPACQAGCSHCCYQHVAVTGAEALLLAEHLRNHWTSPEVEDLRRRIGPEAERFRRIAAEAPSPEAERAALARVRRPCPMLDEAAGRCRAYEARPANCRRENSIDVEVCRRYREDPGATDSSLRLVRFDVIWGAAQAFLARWGAEHLDLDGLMPLDVALALAIGDGSSPDGPIGEDEHDGDENRDPDHLPEP